MDKLTMAHEYFMKHGRNNSWMESDVVDAWKYADAMQAEADSRVNKERPSVLSPHVSHLNNVIAAQNISCSQKEWQPDWSQAPDWANWWCVGQLSGKAMWSKNKPYSIFRNGVSYWNIDFPDGEDSNAPTFNYIGNWQDSLRTRP